MACAVSWACLPRCAETDDVPRARLRDPGVRARGAQLYREDCALCHGENADGRGARSMGLDRKPANFTDPVWSRPESAARAFRAISEGVPGSAMPAWSAALGVDDRWALVAYLTAVSEHGPAAPSRDR